MSDVALEYHNASFFAMATKGQTELLKIYLIFWKCQLLPIIKAGNE